MKRKRPVIFDPSRKGKQEKKPAKPLPFNSAWRRKWKEEEHIVDYTCPWDRNLRMFDEYPQNQNLEVFTKRATLKASSSVTSLQCKDSYTGGNAVFRCSGFIIESFSNYSIILTTANLLKKSRNIEPDDIKVMVRLSDGRSFDGQIEAYDLHYNIAAIKIQSDTLLPTASLAHLNDCITVDPSHHVKEESFQLRPHSNSFNLIPGDLVIALGRFPREPYSIMAAPGLFSIDRCRNCPLKCKELFTASCRITWCGIGGPLINRFGEVIGISLDADVSTAFLPINVASIWWEHYKKYGQTRHPWWSGMEVTNLYAAPLDVLDSIIQKFPDVLEGVIVEEVIDGSDAESAGIKQHDVIIQFNGKRIQSFLELFENMWNKVGEAVELVVVRASDDVPLRLCMVVEKEVKKSGNILYDD